MCVCVCIEYGTRVLCKFVNFTCVHIHVLTNTHNFFLITPASTPKDLTSPSTPRPTGHSGIRRIEVQPQLPIDRNHPVVQQLHSAGFTEGQSIDAVERYETLDRAMEYLMSVGFGDEEEEGMFQMAAPGRQDSSSLKRQSSGGARYMKSLDPL